MVKITATIPVCQYGNIQPEIEADTADEAMAQIRELWKRYAEPGRVLPGATAGKLVKCALGGGSCYFDEPTHSYSHPDGLAMLSGSAFANRYKKEFDDSIAIRYAKTIGVDVEVVREFWRQKGEVSTGYGTSVHLALEIYGKFKGVFPDDKILSGNAHIRKLVLEFYANNDTAHCLYEPFIMHGNLCGFVDRMKKTGNKKIIIEDYKTNADISKGTGYLLPPFNSIKATELNKYGLQLSFYAEIAKRNGYEVEAIVIHHHDGDKWASYRQEPTDITGAL